MSFEPPDPELEMFDVVDEADRVTGQASRAEVHRRGWLHRAVHIFLFRHDGRVLIHQRSARKEDFPLVWTSSASGHVDAGETYQQAAERELQEELQVQAPLRYCFTEPASPDTALEHSAVFCCVTDAEVTPDPNEMDAVELVTPQELAKQFEQDPDRFAPSFRLLWTRYRKWLASGTDFGNDSENASGDE